MNVLQIVRDERPDVAPLDARTREALRTRLVGESTARRPEPLLGDDEMPMPDGGPADATQRRYWLSIAAIVLIAAGLAAVIVAVTRPGPSAPAAPSATTPGTGAPAYEPDTVPVVESMPDPFVAVADDAASDDDSAATTTSTIVHTEPGFTPLALTHPPDGYELLHANFVAGPGGYGVALYGADTHTTQLQLIVRDTPDFFATVRDLGRQTWDIDGHTVYSDGELDGCLHDVCSIGLQWDEHTAISISWVDMQGDALVPGSDQASLLELVPRLVASRQVWQEASPEPIEGDPVLAPSPDQDVEYTGSVVAGPPGSQTAVLRAPDGSMQIVWMVPNATGSSAPGPGTNRRTFGGVAIEADTSSEITLFTMSDACWLVTVADGGGLDVDAPWRPTITELFDNLSTEPFWVTLNLPTGWQLLTLTNPAAVHEVSLTVPTETGEASLQLLQSPGSGAAFHTGLAAYDLERVLFLDGEAWLGKVGSDPVMTAVMWERGGSTYNVQTTGLDVDEIEEIVASMTAITIEEWADRYGPIDGPDGEVELAPGCALPALSIGGP